MNDKRKDPLKQLTVRIPLDLHRRLKAEAALSGTSIGDIIIQLVDSYLKKAEGKRNR